MTEYSQFFNYPAPAGGDDATYSAEEYAWWSRTILGFDANDANRGVARGLTAYDLQVQQLAVAALAVRVRPGYALAYGFWYSNDADEQVDIPANTSGNDRIDRIVLRHVFADGRVRIHHLQGTPAGAPTPPALTQSAVTWDIPLAQVYVANGAGSITDANITDERYYVNLAEGSHLQLTNNSGAAVPVGSVVRFDAVAQNFNTTTVAGDARTAGVVMEYIAAAGSGKLCTHGPAWVRVTGAVAVGDWLRQSTTAGVAETTTGHGFSRALTANAGGTGLVLALVRRRVLEDYIHINDTKAQNTDGGGFTQGAWRTRDLNTILTNQGAYAAVAGNQITLQPGTYRAYITCPALLVNQHQARLYNITGAAVLLTGTTEKTSASYDVMTPSRVVGRFTLAVASVLEVQHQCSSTRAANGFGSAANFTDEIYTVVQLWREVD